jgi:hypothetical protein
MVQNQIAGTRAQVIQIPRGTAEVGILNLCHWKSTQSNILYTLSHTRTSDPHTHVKNVPVDGGGKALQCVETSVLLSAFLPSKYICINILMNK